MKSQLSIIVFYIIKIQNLKYIPFFMTIGDIYTYFINFRLLGGM